MFTRRSRIREKQKDISMTEPTPEPIPSTADLDLLQILSRLPGGFSHSPSQLLLRIPSKAASRELNKILSESKCQRKNLWAFALGIEKTADDIHKGLVDDRTDHQTLEPHRDERQVGLDVNRSFAYYPQNISDAQKSRLRKVLHQTIIRVLRRFPKLCYFQGFHDIVSIFLLNFIDIQPEPCPSTEHETKLENGLGDDQIELLDAVVQRFTLHRIRDSLTNDLSPIMGYLRFTQAILSLERPHLALLISRTSSLPLFSLSWILTLTSHDLESFESISRLFDFLLCYDPIMICYVACAICLTKTDEINELIEKAESAKQEPDLDMVHFIMSKLPVLVVESEQQHIHNLPERDHMDSEQDKVEDEKTSVSNGEVDSEKVDHPRNVDEQSLQETKEANTDCDTPCFPEAQPIESTRKSQKLVVQPRISLTVESVIDSALKLYDLYPPSDDRLKLESILGPSSCMFTWTRSRCNQLNDQEAESILDGPLDEIVRPDSEELTKRKRLAMIRRKEKYLRMLRSLTHRNQVIIGSSVMIGIFALIWTRQDSLGSFLVFRRYSTRMLDQIFSTYLKYR